MIPRVKSGVIVFSALLQRVELEIGQCECAYSTWAGILFPRSKKCTSLVASNVKVPYSAAVKSL